MPCRHTIKTCYKRLLDFVPQFIDWVSIDLYTFCILGVWNDK